MSKPLSTPEARALAKQLRSKQTDSEKLLWKHLQRAQQGVKFRRQCPLLQFVCDFCAPEIKLVVELDGRFHKDREGRDAFRDWLLAQEGYETLRIPSRDVFERLAGVLHDIRAAISRRRRGRACAALGSLAGSTPPSPAVETPAPPAARPAPPAPRLPRRPQATPPLPAPARGGTRFLRERDEP